MGKDVANYRRETESAIIYEWVSVADTAFTSQTQSLLALPNRTYAKPSHQFLILSFF